MKIAILPGDGIGTEIVAEAVKVLKALDLPFEVQAFRKYCLLNGFDDIGLTLQQSDKIKAFEAKRLATKPWLNHTVAG